ncbi:MAG TPA: CPBP family glutamic-type intramembrane protease, partial [Gemmataceae bacterium]|nr:CPBP family glutamic-type intramembrane protease [Gemmataceae bacterium]
MSKTSTYYPATRHPWPCTLFLLPMLLAYESGVLLLGGAHPETLRNGADNWMRFGLTAMGLPYFWLPPLMLALTLVGWNVLRRTDRPKDMLGVLTGMSIESIAFALGLWGVSRALVPIMQHLGVQLEIPQGSNPAVRQVVTYLGAGIYEEALFRLALYSAMVWLLRRLEAPKLLAVLLAAIASATLFSAAHHLGPYGQPYDNYL